MRSSRAAGAGLIALAALVAAALVAAALLAPRTWAVRVGAPGDAFFLSNTYPPERGDQPLRWTRAATALRLHGAYAGPVALGLRLYRDPAGTGGRPWPLELRAGDTRLAAFEAAPGWRRYHVALPPGASAAGLTLAGPTFQPGGGDERALGVALSELRAAPLAGAPLAYALGRAAWLAALLALVGAAAWQLDAWGLGPAAARGRPWRAGALTAGLGASAAAWAWLGPASFAWALPTSWGAAAALAATLLGAGAAGHYYPRISQITQRARAGLPGGRLAAGVGLAGLALAHAALLLPLPPLWRQAGALAVMLAPGALAALALLWDEADGAERAFVAAAGGLGVAALLTLALHALPGPLLAWEALLAADGLSALGLRSLWRAPDAPASRPARPHRWLALPLLVGAAVRLYGLGVSQLQGDEAYAMMLAKGVAHGQEEVLLVHLKGPVEALLPAGPLALAGTISEAGARLPFALAGVALIVAAWSLAGRLLGGRAGDLAGFAAALAVSADGLLLAFGRIVQYQMVVTLLSAAALWLCWRFAEGARASRTLPAAALCAAVAVLAHYDGVYVAPALAWLVVTGGLRRGWGPRQWAAGAGPAVAVGLALTLSFYVPFVSHEHFANTISHLETRSQGATGTVLLYNNLPGYAALLSTYATRYVAAFAGLALLGALAALLAAYLRPRALGAALAGLLLVGAPLGLLAPRALALGPDASLAGLLVIPPLLALALTPRLPLGLRALALWLAGALSAHAFLLADPRTHFYTVHVPGWLLAGWGLARLWELGAPRARAALRPALAGAGGAALALGLTYAGIVFLRPRPEFERAYPATMLPFFAPPTGEALPDDGLFAFPARDGWKAAAVLFEQGVLRGSQDSNQEYFTPGWYLRGQFRCQRDPDYFLTATGATPLYIPPGYSLAATVAVDGVQSIEIYSREPVAGPPRSFDAADYAPAFDAAPVPNFPLRRLLSGVVPQVRIEAAWRDGFALRGFDLDRAELLPGEAAFLTLYWRAAGPLPDTLAPAVQIRDAAGRPMGEAEPYCGGVPAEVWHQTYINDTAFRVPAEGLAPGSYTLVAGVRDLTTGAWLPLADGGEGAPLATLVVRGR